MTRKMGKCKLKLEEVLEEEQYIFGERRLLMRRKVWKARFGKVGVLLLVLTMVFSGCVATEEGVDGGADTPVSTESPQGDKVPEVTAEPEVTQIPESDQTAESSQEQGESNVTDTTGESGQDEGAEGTVEEIIREAYESCKEIYDGIYPEAIKAMTICAATEEYLSVNIATDETLGATEYYHMELACENGQWNVTDFLELYSKNGPYGEEYTSLEPLATDMVIFPEDTVVPLAMGSTVSVDLNGDGVQELVQVSFGAVSTMKKQVPAFGTPYRREEPTVRINDFIFDAEYMAEMAGTYMDSPDMATWYIFDVNTDDGYKEIGLYEAGPSGDPYTTLFRYEDGKLRKIGGFSDNPIEAEICYLDEKDDYQAVVNSVDRSQILIKVVGDGTIYACQRIDVMETNFAEGLWKLVNGDSFEEAVLELQVRDVYEISGFGERDEEFIPTVRNELQVFTEKDLTSEMIVLPQGERIDLYRYYPENEGGWVQISYNNYESYGWIYKTGYDSIYQLDENGKVEYLHGYELIENLSYAD